MKKKPPTQQGDSKRKQDSKNTSPPGQQEPDHKTHDYGSPTAPRKINDENKPGIGKNPTKTK